MTKGAASDNHPEYATQKEDGLMVRVYVQPRASRSEECGTHDGALKIRLTSPPIDGAANAALVEFMAKRFGVPKKAVEIVEGEKSRKKTVFIAGVSLKSIRG